MNMIGYHLTVLHYLYLIILVFMFSQFLSPPSSILITPAPYGHILLLYSRVVLLTKLYCHCRLPLLLPTVAARKEKLSPTLHTGR